MSVTESMTAQRKATWRSVITPSTIALVLMGLAVVWTLGSSYRQDIVVMGAVYALVALGMYLPFNLAGTLSVAYGAYVTLGGYAVGIVLMKFAGPFPLGWVVGAIVAAAVAIVLGFLTSRLSGFYLAAVTMLFASAFTAWVIAAEDITGGGRGLQGIAVPELFGVQVNRFSLMIIAVCVVWVVAMLLDRLRRSPVGSMMIASRDITTAVEATGVPVAKLRLLALGLGAAIASVGGALFVTFNRSIAPDTFTLHFALLAIFMPLIGGAGSAWGAVLGAVVVAQFTLNMPQLGEFGPLIFTTILVLIIVLEPDGLIGLFKRLSRGLQSLRRLRK